MIIEVFPTTASCAAGCSHCPLSRRLDKTPSRDINPEVLTTVKLIADAAQEQKKPIEFVYAGHVDTLAQHVIQMIERPHQINQLRFGYDPKDARTFHQQTQALLQQINTLNEQVSGLALREFSGTIYPKNKFKLTKTEKHFAVKTLKAMATLSGVSPKNNPIHRNPLSYA
jgi:hypothetical protein